MIHPIPSGTRDVLPEETREVRAITDTLRAVFERHDYGELVRILFLPGTGERALHGYTVACRLHHHALEHNAHD